VTGDIVDITELGHRGDGLTSARVGRVIVPFGLPGDRVRLEAPQADRLSTGGERSIRSNRSKESTRTEATRAAIAQIIEKSPNRVVPPCAHFGTCGGCKLQHAEDEFYRAWKTEQVAGRLVRSGVDPVQVHPILPCPPATRRRATFTARRHSGTGDLVLGYQMASSHRLLDLAVCPVLVPEIVAELDALRALSRLLLCGPETPPDNAKLRLAVTATATGLDIDVQGTPKLTLARMPALLEDLSALVNRRGWARLTLEGEEIAQVCPPELVLGPARIVLPPGGFCQATRVAEQHLIRLVTAAVGPSAPIADLFAGIGTFTFPLAVQAPVHAVDGDGRAVQAIQRARDKTPGLKQITVESRDLFRNPLTERELRAFDTAIFDPPRAGARAQTEALAKSGLAAIIGVSCNPASFARDARILVDGGYVLTEVFPVDQFLWSPHIELVGVFRRF